MVLWGEVCIVDRAAKCCSVAIKRRNLSKRRKQRKRQLPFVMPSIHPNPRKRFGLEIARFTIYLTVPVVAIAIGNDPKTMNGLLSRFNFVEYPPESEKLPSGDEIVKRLQEREARRLRGKIDSATAVIDAHIAALPSEPITTQTLKQEEAASTVVKKGQGRGWFGWFRRGSLPRGSDNAESLPK